jgi:putative ABC transport system permease protein
MVGALRTVAQLYAVGFILASVFATNRWYWVVATLSAMAAIAAHALLGRLRRPLPHGGRIAAIALTASTATTLAWVILVVVRQQPWYAPQYVIPIAGMILGNAMTGAALAGERLQSELHNRSGEVEAMLALGFTGADAVAPMVRAAVRAGMVPSITAMMTVGLVQLPGMMTGQILAGVSPIVAIEYQIVVMFMLAAATAVAALLFVRLAVAEFLTPAHQLRRYLL